MKTGLDAMPLFLLDDLLSQVQISRVFLTIIYLLFKNNTPQNSIHCLNFYQYCLSVSFLFCCLWSPGSMMVSRPAQFFRSGGSSARVSLNTFEFRHLGCDRVDRKRKWHLSHAAQAPANLVFQQRQNT